jgi:translation initiation factor 3 subunit G
MLGTHETTPDKNGIKHVVEYKTNSEGKTVRITKKVRICTIISQGPKYKKEQRIEERKKNWKKFGKFANSNDMGVTLRGDEIFLYLGEDGRKKKEKIDQEKKDKQEVDALLESLSSNKKKIGCGSCSSPPIESIWKPSWSKNGESGPPTETKSLYVSSYKTETSTASVYVPPYKKMAVNDDITTIRVTNLSEETREGDLNTMFQKFGKVGRIHLVKDKLTGASRGFAFVTFVNKQDAQNAINEIDGQGWDNLIVRVEWADK